MPIDLTREYLRQEYTLNGRSDRDIAQEFDTYPNAVARLRRRYGIASRNKSEAQRVAIESGRHAHPTKGRQRDANERRRISEGVARNWEEKSEFERQEYAARAKRQWEESSDEHKEAMRTAAAQAVREAAEFGSKLERFLLEELSGRGYRVEYHKDDMLPNEKLHVDLYLPDQRIAIEVDGIAHFEPIWGEEYLEKRRAADLQKTGLILSLGLVFIRVKHTTRSLSEKTKRQILAGVLGVVTDPPKEARLIEIEGK